MHQMVGCRGGAGNDINIIIVVGHTKSIRNGPISYANIINWVLVEFLTSFQRKTKLGEMSHSKVLCLVLLCTSTTFPSSDDRPSTRHLEDF